MEKNQTNQYGNPNGYWEIYYSNGQLECKGNYVNSKAHGYWEEYYDNGQLYFKGNYVNGNTHGYWETYFDNGQLYSKGNYVNGEPHGCIKHYSYNGEETKVNFYDMGVEVDYLPYEFALRTLKTRNTNNIGQVKIEDAESEITRLNSQDDKNWRMDDSEFMFVTDETDNNVSNPCKLLDGYVWITCEPIYFVNSINSNSEKHGYWEGCYDDGRLYYKGTFLNGKQHGFWEEYYYKTGYLKSRGFYVNGEKHGKWLLCDKDGNTNYLGYFDNGKKVNYDSNFPPLLIRLKRKLKSLFTKK
jgi:antitoxin component YwqK of YwqJK toxin-antitoxin module